MRKQEERVCVRGWGGLRAETEKTSRTKPLQTDKKLTGGWRSGAKLFDACCHDSEEFESITDHDNQGVTLGHTGLLGAIVAALRKGGGGGGRANPAAGRTAGVATVSGSIVLACTGSAWRRCWSMGFSAVEAAVDTFGSIAS